jgi:riboflavin kinase/FMN adenylyltransferase
LETIRISTPEEASGLHPDSQKQVLAIGDFDGVHSGHRQVIRRAVDIAAEAGIISAVMTFDPHPRVVLGQDEYAHCITPLSAKLALIEELGIDRTYVVKFDADFSKLHPEQFVEHMLKPLSLHALVVGFDFTFGFQGRGTAKTLKELAEPGIRVEIVDPYHINGEKVSSTLIREQLLSGRIPEANALLGRPYSLSGTVVRGDGRGRSIGFPTANIALTEPFIIPKPGVYAIEAELKGQTYHGVMNIGYKPTFSDKRDLTLEAHLFHYSGNLYDERLTIRFRAFIREERKFPSVDELVRQIRSDAEQARKWLAAAAAEPAG